jgi:hypothetical protein
MLFCCFVVLLFSAVVGSFDYYVTEHGGSHGSLGFKGRTKYVRTTDRGKNQFQPCDMRATNRKKNDPTRQKDSLREISSRRRMRECKVENLKL